MISNRKHKRGRPFLTEAQKTERKEYLLQKLEPYLKSGLSLRKALRDAGIFNSEFYRYLAEDELFGAKIAYYRQYIGVLANQAIVQELFFIFKKQNKGNILSKDDRDFLWHYAISSSLCKEEWGRLINIDSYNSEAEIERAKVFIS